MIDSNIAPSLWTRTLGRGAGAELYLTARSRSGETAETAARRIYSAIAEDLRAADARLLGERFFAVRDAVDTIAAVRHERLGDLDDGVPPTRVVVTPGSDGVGLVGVQVHAVRGPWRPKVLRCWERSEGHPARLLDVEGRRWLFIHGLTASAEAPAAEQARRMFLCTGCLLGQAGATMKDVPRTWLWLDDVCSWYGEFNLVRTAFFHSAGLVDLDQHSTHLPASTGIGLGSASGAACTLDLIAIPGGAAEFELVESGGDQRSAYEYGSAFSRAALVRMPGGTTVFLSGTAAIDARGRTEHVGRISEQVDATLAHARSLLAELGCGDDDVLTALVYAKSPAVEQVFRESCGDIAWPHVTMIGDACRPDLLFEVEVTATPSREVPLDVMN